MHECSIFKLSHCCWILNAFGIFSKTTSMARLAMEANIRLLSKK